MKPEYESLIADIRHRFISKIERANKNPDRWYELFIDKGEEGTESVAHADTFSEIVQDFEKYADQYGLDCINIDIWKNREYPEPVGIELCPTELMYFFLEWNFRSAGTLNSMKMVGRSIYPFDGSKPTFTRDHCGEGEYFADEIAFRYFRHLVCHICEHSEPADPNDESGIIGPDQGYTRADLVAMCGGDEGKAAELFGRLDWRSPETLLNEWDDDNE